jgi:competence protein ComEC
MQGVRQSRVQGAIRNPKSEMDIQKPVTSLTLAYLAGILLGHGFLYFPYTVGILLILGILSTGVFSRFEKQSLRRFLLYLIPGLIGMAASVYSAVWLPADHFTRHVPLDKTSRILEGSISSPLDRDPGRTAFIMELIRVDGTPVRGSVRVSVREEIASLGYGDLVRVSGKMRKPGSFMNPGGFDYAEYLARSGVFATVSVRTGDDIALLKRGAGVFRTIQDWRERIRQAFLASTAGPGSAILQAMVLGEEGGLTEELRDRFLAAGVTHIISISGSHLGMVALLCFGLMRGFLFLLPERPYHRLTLFVDPKKIAAWLTLPLLIFYTLLAGGQVATVRSLIMITAGLAALILDREHSLMHSLALAALVILAASPQAVFDISFQLSYLSVLVIGYVVSLWNDIGVKASGRIMKFAQGVALLMIISLATSLATGPLVARYFNQFSLAGLVSNLVIVPFAGAVVVPLGLFSGILSLFTNHLPLARMDQVVSDAFIELVSFFSRLPFAEFHPKAPGVLWLSCYAVFFLCLLHMLRIHLVSRFKPFEGSARISLLPKITFALTASFLLLGLTPSLLPKKHTVISFPDVGQGDCALIEFASGKTVLIDGGGTADNRFDIGRRVVAPFLWNRGVRRLDLVVLSHPHPDHMNGLLYPLRKFSVGEVWDHGLDADHPGYERFRQVVAEKKIVRRTASAEDPPLSFGGAELRVLHPAKGFGDPERKTSSAINDRSLVIRIADRGRTYLFTGDIEKKAEKSLLADGRDLKCDLLKVPHHGGKSSSAEAFVSLARPAVAVVDVGRENPYHHPADEVLARYERSGAEICRTDRDGAVFITADGDRMNVTRWSALILQRIAVDDLTPWSERERNNWERFWIRKWEI